MIVSRLKFDRRLMRPRFVSAFTPLTLIAAIACSDGQQILAERHPEVEGGTAGALDPPAPSDDLSACASARFEKSLRPLLLYILLDQSGSMKEDEDRYTPVAKAIQGFAESSSSSGIRAAIQYFGLGSSPEQKCSPESYALPEVEPSLLPAEAAPIVSSLQAHNFPRELCCTNDNEHQGTPTRPAVEGTLNYLAERRLSHPEEVQALLLATDGLPTDDCDENTLDDVSALLEDASLSETPVKTYVIGIGEDDSLDMLAEAGRTGEQAFLVDGTGVTTEDEFFSALNTIRGQAVPCDYDLPAMALENRERVNVTYRSEGNAEPITAVAVASASDCDPAVDQWFYEEGASATRIRLCPRLCRTVSQDSSGAVEIVVGCETRVR